MSKTNNLKDYLTDLADAIRAKQGSNEKINPQNFRTCVEALHNDLEAEQYGQIFTPVATPVYTADGGTAYIADNPNLGFVTEETEETVLHDTDLGVVTRRTDLKGEPRIFKRWSLKEMNERWKRNGFKRTVADGGTYDLAEPIGLAVRCNGMGWKLLGWAYYKDDSVEDPPRYYDITGNTAVDHANNLRHSHWFNGGSPFYNSVASGADAEAEIVANTDANGVAGKMLSNEWSVVAVDDTHLAFVSANTGASFTFKKVTGAVVANCGTEDEDARTDYLWQFSEWYRHSYAIYSGLTTENLADNGQVKTLILNANGETAAVGEDMYFWLTDGTNKINTGLLAKYNINAQHGTSGGSGYLPLRTSVRDYIYNQQIAKGVNMDDTGVNSTTRPLLTPGAKGSEAILAGDKWMIATPTITRASASTSLDYNIPDCPAVAWAKNVAGLALCNDLLGSSYYYNRAAQTSNPRCTNLYAALATYLASYEGWYSPTLGVGHRIVYITGEYGSSVLWCAVRSYATVAWVCDASSGYVTTYGTSPRYRCVPSSALV